MEDVRHVLSDHYFHGIVCGVREGHLRLDIKMCSIEEMLWIKFYRSFLSLHASCEEFCAVVAASPCCVVLIRRCRELYIIAKLFLP